MYLGDLNLNLIVQGLIAVILIGMFYTLWATTHAYGGVVGRALKVLGFGIIFICASVIEKILINFNVIQMTPNISLIQDVLNLAGLSLLAWSFMKLIRASRT